ncbi:MAG TPA: hypothetical protein VFF15_00295 [Flavobacteriaceae bacterium]|nr:hypothetical protein [Flavobacteriaceae bacterium]
MPSGVEAQAKTPFNPLLTHLPTHRLCQYGVHTDAGEHAKSEYHI